MPDEDLISGYPVRFDRAYQPDYGCWIRADGNRLTIGLDALTQESYGDLIALELSELGVQLEAGQEFGTLEAGKFVGPLLSPVSGRVVAVNHNAVERPSLVNREPYDGGWLVVIEVLDPALSMSQLLQGPAIREVFEERVLRFRREGMLAE